MEFTVSILNLLKTLKRLGGIIKTKNKVLPILDNFLFEIKKEKLIITATDLESTVISQIDIKSNISCQIVVPAKLMINILKTFSEQDIIFYIKKEKNLIEMKTNNGSYSLTIQNIEEFPSIPILTKYDKINLKKEILLKSINQTLFATSTDELRQVLTGILLQITNDFIIFVATDAQILVKCVQKISKSEYNSEFIIPKKAIQLLKSILNKTKSLNIILEYNQTNIRFICDEEILVCRLIDGKFPDYQLVIPKANNNILIIQRLKLLKTLKRISLFSNQITNQIFFKIYKPYELEINTNNPEFSIEARENIPCNYNGKKLKIGLNYKFLIDMLLHLTNEEISFQISDPNSAIILQPLNQSEDLLMILMPLMSNK